MPVDARIRNAAAATYGLTPEQYAGEIAAMPARRQRRWILRLLGAAQLPPMLLLVAVGANSAVQGRTIAASVAVVLLVGLGCCSAWCFAAARNA
ncbi:MAG: hypothetical protein EPO06_11840 [Burkholderiaceae bacterium]|nr:MAG: hypothetical protein EPO06_11840 [Burkholderiaceae bacterium]